MVVSGSSGEAPFALTTLAGGVSPYPVPEPWYELDKRYRAGFEEHLAIRVGQHWPSTVRMVRERQQRAGMMAECAFKFFIRLPPDFRNKPKGDHGADAVTRLLIPNVLAQLWLSAPVRQKPSEFWADVDVKATMDPSEDFFFPAKMDKPPRFGLEPMKLYVAAYSPYREAHRVRLTGWLLGREVLALGRAEWFEKGENWAYHVDRSRLYPMSELKAMVLNGFHADDPRLTNWPRS